MVESRCRQRCASSPQSVLKAGVTSFPLGYPRVQVRATNNPGRRAGARCEPTTPPVVGGLLRSLGGRSRCSKPEGKPDGNLAGKLALRTISWLLSIAWSVCLPSQVVAQPETPLVRGESNCPDPMAVQTEVFRLSSSERRAQELPGASVVVVDVGESYRVEITKAGERFDKTYSDPARECDKRVRFAAIFVVMTLMPPELRTDGEHAAAADREGDVGEAAAEEQDSTEPAGASRQPHAAPAPPVPVERSQGSVGATGDISADVGHGAPGESSGVRVDVELMGALHQSLSDTDSPRIASIGLEALLAVGGETLAWFGAVGGTPKVRFEVGDVHAELSEVSFRSGVRQQWESGAWRVASDVGAVASRRSILALGAETNTPRVAWEVGLGAGLGGARRLGGMAAGLFSLRASYYPKPSELSVVPRGRLSQMPSWWLAALLGVRVSF